MGLCVFWMELENYLVGLYFFFFYIEIFVVSFREWNNYSKSYISEFIEYLEIHYVLSIILLILSYLSKIDFINKPQIS